MEKRWSTLYIDTGFHFLRFLEFFCLLFFVFLQNKIWDTRGFLARLQIVGYSCLAWWLVSRSWLACAFLILIFGASLNHQTHRPCTHNSHQFLRPGWMRIAVHRTYTGWSFCSMNKMCGKKIRHPVNFYK